MFFIHFASANELPGFTVYENENRNRERDKLVFRYADLEHAFQRKTNCIYPRQIMELYFLTFSFHNTILNRRGLPYIFQLFNLDLEDGKGPIDKDDKSAEASNDWFIVIYAA